jgi:hypothetical protein
MIQLVRDPRDIMTSWLDAAKEGSWRIEENWRGGQAAGCHRPETGHKLFGQPAEGQSGLRRSPGPKTLVRYEHLRADALATIKRK